MCVLYVRAEERALQAAAESAVRAQLYVSLAMGMCCLWARVWVSLARAIHKHESDQLCILHILRALVRTYLCVRIYICVCVLCVCAHVRVCVVWQGPSSVKWLTGDTTSISLDPRVCCRQPELSNTLDR